MRRLANLAIGFVTPVVVLTLAATSIGSIGCSSGETSPSPSGTSKTDTSKTDPPETDAKAADSLGPSCTAFIACCKELTAKNPQASASCDSVEKSIEDAQAKGVTTETYESACKSGLDSYKTAGYCK